MGPHCPMATWQARRRYSERLDLARAFLQQKQVPFGLRNKIFSYYALRNPGGLYFDEQVHATSYLHAPSLTLRDPRWLGRPSSRASRRLCGGR